MSSASLPLEGLDKQSNLSTVLAAAAKEQEERRRAVWALAPPFEFHSTSSTDSFVVGSAPSGSSLLHVSQHSPLVSHTVTRPSHVRSHSYSFAPSSTHGPTAAPLAPISTSSQRLSTPRAFHSAHSSQPSLPFPHQSGHSHHSSISSQGGTFETWNWRADTDVAVQHLILDARRQDLVESPATKLKAKDFFRELRSREKDGYRSAKEFTQQHVNSLPLKSHWKVYLEMADLAKRENRLQETRRLYAIVHELQPFASQGWLEHAKMEEECGDMVECQSLLARGLAHCPPVASESLVIRSLRCEERLGHLENARALLAGLINEPVTRVWRAILEGANMEARVGCLSVAREVFRYLMFHLPSYGPVFHDALRVEERAGNVSRAIAIADRGLATVPRYGPLWFGAFHVYERVSYENVCQVALRALGSVSKELVWKVHFERAQIHERAKNLEAARSAFAQSAIHCPSNLLWKVWLGGARLEASCRNFDRARAFLNRAVLDAPQKTRASVRIEQARLEEFAGDVASARSILVAAKKESKHEWKVFLEAVMLEIRCHRPEAAICEAWSALQIHRGTGRLWAVLIQLMQIKGESAQLRVFKAAQEEVPKSGEVWCEGARIFMNPLSKQFDLDIAQRFLDWAVQFTPQYGDSFLELLRLRILVQGPSADLKQLEQMCIYADPNYGAMWFYCRRHSLDTPRDVLRNAAVRMQLELYEARHIYACALLKQNENHSGKFSESDFCTGMVSLCRLLRRPRTDDERWLLIFGGDSIVP